MKISQSRLLDGVGILIALIFTISGILVLPQSGISFDEGLGNIFFGERYFRYFTSLDANYLNFNRQIELPDGSLNTFASIERNVPYTFPALVDTLSAGAMYTLAYRLNWMDPVDAFHLPKVLLAGGFVWLFYIQLRKRIGATGAIVATLFLAFFPRFWGDMRFNPKDIPETVLWGTTIFAYLEWHERPTLGRLVLVGVCFGAALAIKINAVFIPVVLLLAVLPWTPHTEDWMIELRRLVRYLPAYFTLLGVALGVYILSWPYLYPNPLKGLSEYFGLMTSLSQDGGSGFNWLPLVNVVITMPELMLLLALCGFIVLFRRGDTKTLFGRVLFFWLLIPVLRSTLPGMKSFDVIRHFMEFVPAAAAIGGLGAQGLVDSLPRLKLRRILIWGLVGCLLVNGIVTLAAFHPYEQVYYNQIIGGLAGARRLLGANDATDYWATSYRNGLVWVNNNLPANAALYVPSASWLVQIPQYRWLRADIQLLVLDKASPPKSLGEDVFVMFMVRPMFYETIAWECVSHYQPIYQINVNGVEILVVYKMPRSEFARVQFIGGK